MTHRLYLGDPTYSSWSMRAWLLVDRFNIPVETIWVDFTRGAVAGQIEDVVPAQTVPTLCTPDETVIWDSLAIAEELADRHPEAELWPPLPSARATARSLVAEMHSGFPTLRNECPMNLRVAYSGVPVTDALAIELRRLERIWDHACTNYGNESPWLCGDYSIADAFYAPVAARIAAYGLAVSEAARTYVDAHLAEPSFRRWRAMGLARGGIVARYDRSYPQRAWPGPVPRPARAVESGRAVNDACPFSGKPVSHLAEIDGRVIGFCNAFCRDKSVADADAWPVVSALLDA